VVDRVEAAHARKHVGDRGGDGQCKVDLDQHDRDVAHARQDLAQRVETFGAEVLHAAHAHHRQKDQRDDDDAEPAKPLQDRPPEQEAAGFSSSPVMIVVPVVVMPDIASNSAFTTRSPLAIPAGTGSRRTPAARPR
jgi:hypothetical protein